MPQPGEVQTLCPLEAGRRQAGLGPLLDAPGRARLLGPVGDRFCDSGGDPLVEDRGDDVVLREVFHGDHACHSFGRCELHRLVYLTGPHIEGSPEDTGEAEDVVDLVRVVASACCDDPRLPHRHLGPYLGVGVGHGEDDGVGVHALDVLYGEYVWYREPQEEVGAGHGVREIACPTLGVRVLGEPPLGLVQVLAPSWTIPFESQPTMFFAPAAIMILAQATPEAPTPLITMRRFWMSLSTILRELIRAASATTAVPCWSSWKTGMSRSFFSRSSISKHRGAEISSRFMPPNAGARFLTVSTIASVSLVSRQIGNASTFANCLKSAALPSITGIAARGPMSPSPRTAVPSETTATVLRFTVRLKALSGSLAIALQTRATPGV